MKRAPYGTVLKAILASLVLSAASTQTAVGEIKFGGSASGLAVYTFEAFEPYASGQGSAFVTLRDDAFGVTFGEKLVGQELTYDNGFDVVTGSPDVPLTMDESMDAIFGVNVLRAWTTVIDGVGPAGFPLPDGIGDGALTVLFDLNQSAVAFDVLGANSGLMVVDFFNRVGLHLGSMTVDEVANGTYIFSSTEGNIAAMTIWNMDWGGIGFDNFVFAPGDAQFAGACTVGGPFTVYAADEVSYINLDGRSDDDPNGTEYLYQWVSDCPGAAFSSRSAAETTLEIHSADPCTVECSVTLMVGDGVFADICSATVEIVGLDPTVTLVCPADLTVENDGAGNVAELEAWLTDVEPFSDTVVNDFAGLNYTCGTSGSAEVTWVDTSPSAEGCGGLPTCSGTFTVVDTTPPELFVDTAPLVVENRDCAAAVDVAIPEAFAVDTVDGDLPVVNDAPATFPAGQTTTVTYTAVDACGNTATATLDVTVLTNAGVEVTVLHAQGNAGRGNNANTVPMPGVTVLVFDVNNGSCDVLDQQGNGVPNRDYADVVLECTPVTSVVTDEFGVADVGVLEGQYVLIALVDVDGDGQPDELFGGPTGQIDCGHWKSRTLIYR